MGPDFTVDCIKLHEKFKMEEICEQIRLNKIDRMFYKEKCLKINNLSRKEWIDTENPLLVAVECNRVDLVDFFIYVGININSIQRNGNTIKTPLNEALRRNHQNIIELLLKKKVNLTLFEVNSKGQKCYPMDLANEAQKKYYNSIHAESTFLINDN